uniref:Longin domain-containing protein n=1 Tax=Trichuris muris TaxID=70415 RepID=A0A5S6QUY4_TRIMR
MIYMTLIARVHDGLPLATSIEGDETQGIGISKYTSQAKMLFRKLNANSPKKCSLESGAHIFHYLIEGKVCYLCLCDLKLPTSVAFAFLDELSREFSSRYSNRVDSVSRPYHFIEFDACIQDIRKKHTDYRNRYQLSMVHNDLQDVQRIMVQNIEDVIHRGEALTILDDKAANLAVMSQKFKKEAHLLNIRSSFVKVYLL